MHELDKTYEKENQKIMIIRTQLLKQFEKRMEVKK